MPPVTATDPAITSSEIAHDANSACSGARMRSASPCARRKPRTATSSSPRPHQPMSGAAEQMPTAISAGDEPAFVGLAERYRRPLHVHCYRMVGSLEDAEDLVQESILRAWRARTSFEGRSSFRGWLYRIATNACLDHLQRRPARVLAPDVVPASDPSADLPAPAELPWLDPYPDR